MTGSEVVQILARDPLQAAGIAAMLKTEPGWSVRVFDAQERCDVIVAEMDQGTRQALLVRARAASIQQTPVVALSDGRHADSEQLAEAGVVRIVYRPEVSGSAMLEAVRDACSATAMTCQERRAELDRQLGSMSEKLSGPEARPTMSEREIAVLRHLAQGHHTPDIMKAMNISERTVKYVLWGLMKRFDLRNRVHTVAFAIRAGYI